MLPIGLLFAVQPLFTGFVICRFVGKAGDRLSLRCRSEPEMQDQPFQPFRLCHLENVTRCLRAITIRNHTIAESGLRNSPDAKA